MTLIDVAIAMIVVGVLAIPLAKAYDVQRMKNISNSVITSFLLTEKAIGDFYFDNYRYPCPADLTLSPLSPDYGVEVCPGDPLDPDEVLEGGIPFITLDLPESESLDGWGNKITYAVTQKLSDINLSDYDFNPGTADSGLTKDFKSDGGSITVSGWNEKGHAVTGERVCDYSVAPDGQGAMNAHFILISHGPTSIGAYNNVGVLTQPCTRGTTRDSANCDGDAEFFHQTCSGHTAKGADFYDDMTHTGRATPSRMWSDTLLDSKNVVTGAGYIGIGTNDPRAELHVVGNVMMESLPGKDDKKGDIHTTEICNDGGDSITDLLYCYETMLIAGNDPRMNCDSKGLTGIGDSRARCGVKYFVGTKRICDTGRGQLMKGLSDTGNAVCGVPGTP